MPAAAAAYNMLGSARNTGGVSKWFAQPRRREFFAPLKSCLLTFKVLHTFNAKAYEKDSFGVKKLTEGEIRSIAANYIDVVMAFYGAPKNEDGFVSVLKFDKDVLESLYSLNNAPSDPLVNDPYMLLIRNITNAKTVLLELGGLPEQTREALLRNSYSDDMISMEVIDYIMMRAVVPNSTKKDVALSALIIGSFVVPFSASLWGLQ